MSRPTEKPATVVVLGSSDPARQEYRVNGLVRLLHTRPVSRVILAGRGEAPRMAQLVLAKMANPPPMVIEDRSTNTVTNISQVAQLLDRDERVILVSDHHHVRGASHCLAKMGWETSYYIIPEPHHGYAVEAGYSMAVPWSNLPNPQVIPSPDQCESGYYFYCC